MPRNRHVDCDTCGHHYDQHAHDGPCRLCECRRWKAIVGTNPHKVSIARQQGLSGRNSTSSAVIAIERRVLAALATV